MTLNELCETLWSMNCDTCPCEMGIGCVYGDEDCGTMDDCIAGVVEYWETHKD